MEKKHTVIHNTAEKRYELDLGAGDIVPKWRCSSTCRAKGSSS